MESEGDEIKSKQASKSDRTLLNLWQKCKEFKIQISFICRSIFAIYCISMKTFHSLWTLLILGSGSLCGNAKTKNLFGSF